MGKKVVARLLACHLPRTLQELQLVAGKLNRCVPFIADFKRTVRPIIGILSGDNFGRWRKEQTQALNTIAGMVQARLQVHLVDRDRELQLCVD